MKHYSTIKNKYYGAVWMNLENIMLTEGARHKKVTCCGIPKGEWLCVCVCVHVHVRVRERERRYGSVMKMLWN